MSTADPENVRLSSLTPLDTSALYNKNSKYSSMEHLFWANRSNPFVQKRRQKSLSQSASSCSLTDSEYGSVRPRTEVDSVFLNSPTYTPMLPSMSEFSVVDRRNRMNCESKQ